MVLGGGAGGVAVGESAEEGVGEEAGYLHLGQGDGGSFAPPEQRDALKESPGVIFIYPYIGLIITTTLYVHMND